MNFRAGINPLSAFLGLITFWSLGGGIVYLIWGWPNAGWFIFLLILVALLLAGFWSMLNRPSPTPEPTPAWRPIDCLINLALIIFFVVYFVYLKKHSATDWTVSPWQMVSLKFILLTPLAFAALLWLGIKNKLSATTLWVALFCLLSINVLIFSNGFGFDIFVHAATVRAWLATGQITPLSPLYSGWYGLIASLNFFSQKISLASLIAWAFPLLAATILTSAYIQLRRTHNHLIALFFLITFFIFWQPLWTTQTPQAWGHILLLGLVIDFFCWQKNDNKKINGWWGRLLLAAGLTLIHPLSGLPAGALIIFCWINEIKTKPIKPILAALFFLTIILTPAVLLKITTGATTQPFWPTIANLFSTPFFSNQNFNSAIVARLTSNWQMLYPLVALILIILGIYKAPQTEKILLQKLTLVASAVALSGIATLFLQMPNLINYEQGAFAQRLYLAALIIAWPAALQGLLWIWQTTKLRGQIIFFATIICLIGLAWYGAHPRFDSAMRAKGFSVTNTDLKIVQEIDQHAQAQPYLVLADQTTAAAALETFGFLERRWPQTDFYFYPIPTGGELYTKYFLPAMYQPIAPEKLRAAAALAHVKQIFIVLKPYWNAKPEIAAALKNNTTDWWTVGGVLIGHYQVP